MQKKNVRKNVPNPSVQTTILRHADTRRMRGQEVETLREERSKTFALGRGLYQTVVYPERVHYRDRQGDWQDIDNRLTPVAGNDGALENTSGPLRMRFGNRADAEALVTMEDQQGRSLCWRLEGASGAPVTREEMFTSGEDEDENRAHADESVSAVRYAGLLPHTDLICELRGDCLKEALVLKGPDAPERYVYTMEVGPLMWEETEGGGLRLWDEAKPGEDVFRVPPPYMMDAAGQEGKLETTWEEQDGQLRMTLTPAADFLQSAVYPVTIDPTVQSSQTATKIIDTYISEENNTKNYGSATSLRVGKHDGYKECRALIKIEDLPTLSSAYTIAKAWMGVAVLPTTSMKEDAYLYAHEVMADWTVGTVKWDTQPAYGEKHLDYALVKKGESAAKTAQLDITNLVRKWYANKAANCGIMLDSHEEQPITLCASENTTYTSTARPIIYVNYVSDAGLEGYRSYESFGAGRAGTAHVALHSGHLVVTRGLTSMNGNRMPISLGLTWNACAMDKNAFGVGNGWRLNWNQNLRREKPKTGDTYYVLTDGDGTEHEFHKHEKTEEEKQDTTFVDYYEDRSGLSLKLYEVGTEAEIVSKGHSKLVFDKPTTDYTTANNAIKMVKRALDAHGNTATFTHNTNFRLTKVVDGADRVTTLTYTDTDVKIAVPGYESQVVLTLDADKRLTKVTDLDGEWSEYEYVGGTEATKNRLACVRNKVDGYYVVPTYDASGRVSQMNAYGVEGETTVEGNARGYEYFDCVTQVKDLTVPDGKVLTYQFNDYGNVVAVHDELGFASFAKFGMGQPNTPEAVSKLHRLVVNLLDAHDFVADSGWKTGVIDVDGTERENEEIATMGLKPLCLERRAGPEETSYGSYQKALSAGEYTFSVYVRSRGNTLCWAEAAWQDEDGQWHTASSEQVRKVGSPLRLSCTIQLPEAATVRCRVLAGEGSGAAWFDRAQLETGALANRHNLLRNANFTVQEITELETLELPTSWLGAEKEGDEPKVTLPIGGLPTKTLPAGWLIGEDSGDLLESDIKPIVYDKREYDYPLSAELVEKINADKRKAAKDTTYKQKFEKELQEQVKKTAKKPKIRIVEAEDSPNKPKDLGGNCLMVQSAPGVKVGIYQELDIQGEKGDNYVVGGWSRAWAAPKVENRSFRLRVRFQKKSGAWADGGTADWNEEWVDWQYACGAAVAPDGYRKIRVYIDLDEGLNEAQIGVVSLTKEYYGQNFAYDEKNNVTAVSTLLGQKDRAEYDKFDNLESYVQPGRDEEDKYTFFYGDTDAEKKRHLALRSETPLGVVSETKYDGYGNAVKGVTRNKADEKFMEAHTTYTADGNYTANATNARGMTTWSETDPNKGLALSATDALGQSVAYQYDASGRVTETKAEVGEKAYKNAYTYEKDRLKTVSHNTTGEEVDVTYTFETDALGNQTKVKVGEQLLSENHYTDTGDKLLEAVTYGNGGAVKYTYDSFKRTTGIRYDDAEEPRFTYEYGANGAVGRVKDTELGREARMVYDLAERPVEAELYENGKPHYRLTQEYDRFEQPSVLHERLENEDGTGDEYTIAVGYDKESKPEELTYSAGESVKRKLTYAYDGLGRLAKRSFLGDAENDEPLFESAYIYATGGYGKDSTTTLVQSIEQLGGKHQYWYDAVGNISKERWQGKTVAGGTLTGLSFEGQPLSCECDDGLTLVGLSIGAGASGGVEARYDTSYAYDALGQLVRVNDQREQATWVYAYDQGGNILEKKRYGYTTAKELSGMEPEQVIPYSYEDANWKDKLTAYDGKPITYDAIGNPLSYDGWTYTWKAGRMLHSMSNGITNAEFTYDHTGLRVKKSVNGVDTLYTMNGKKITHIRKGMNNATGDDTIQMHFFYDVQGRPAIVRYNGVDYAYLHNLQGDVTGIVDMEGVLVVQYGYNVWGRPIGTDGSLAETLGRDNPFRYRGYVWDEETELYYLRSRYYKPEWGRFVNADSELQKSQIIGINLFCYCKNSPVGYVDHSGKRPMTSYEARNYWYGRHRQKEQQQRKRHYKLKNGGKFNTPQKIGGYPGVASLVLESVTYLTPEQADQYYHNMTGTSSAPGTAGWIVAVGGVAVNTKPLATILGAGLSAGLGYFFGGVSVALAMAGQLAADDARRFEDAMGPGKGVIIVQMSSPGPGTGTQTTNRYFPWDGSSEYGSYPVATPYWEHSNWDGSVQFPSPNDVRLIVF